jgi:phosphomannomutase/phosphoglucomutase
MPTKINDKIFREYDIRGIADRDLTDATCEQLGRAIATFIRAKGGKKITLGMDCRPSSERIRSALSKALNASGIDTIDIGLVPTPLLYFSVSYLQMDGGIMITGSHNPAEHNGLKICVGPSTIHGEEIQEIRQIANRGDFPTGHGTHTQRPITEDYLAYVTKNIRHPLNVKVVVDSGNGMGGVVAPELYRRLGCEVIELFSEPDGRFPNHHPDPTVIDNLQHLIRAVTEHKATLGIGFDGDADRIGVVDATGRVLFGDELLVLYARQVLKEHPGATVISEVKASHRLFQDIAGHGGKPILWKTGHSLIKAKMKETGALLAGEMSGHMFFKDRYFGFDDAVYAGARILEIVDAEKSTPAKLLHDLPPSFSTPEIRVDCPDDVKFEVVAKAREDMQSRGLKVNDIDGARIDFGDGWGLVRASNTQPVLVYRFEASTQARLKEIQKTVEDTVTRLLPK